MPTIFEILGITIPHYAQGKSFLSLIKKNKRTIHKYVYGYNNESSYIRSLKWKLIMNNNFKQAELYNIKNDPKEKKNVYYINFEIGRTLKEKLIKWLKSLPLYNRQKNEFLPYIDEKTREKIRKTGYW
jgi:arylsulfatase A-like enzyme